MVFTNESGRICIILLFFGEILHLLWHQVLHALGLRAGVIIAVTFQQVNRAPDAKAGTERHDEGLQYTDC